MDATLACYLTNQNGGGGAAGSQGAQGAQGSAGVQGQTGSVGAQGSVGAVGQQGAAGATGVDSDGAAAILDFGGVAPLTTVGVSAFAQPWNHVATLLVSAVAADVPTVYTFYSPDAARTLAEPRLAVSLVGTGDVTPIVDEFAVLATVYVNGVATAVTAEVLFTGAILALPAFMTSDGAGTAQVDAGDAITVQIESSPTTLVPANATLGIAFSLTATEINVV